MNDPSGNYLQIYLISDLLSRCGLIQHLNKDLIVRETNTKVIDILRNHFFFLEDFRI